MPITESTTFVYDGIDSADMGIINVNIDTGMLSEPFFANREILQETIRGRERPYFYGVKYEPIRIDLNFAFKDTWDEAKIREVARWLRQDYYKEMYFSENPNRRFYVMYSGDSDLLHNSLRQGYVSITMTNIDCYTYSPIYNSQIYDFSTNPTFKNIQIANEGDQECFPIMYLEKIGAGNVKIINNSNNGQEFLIQNLTNGENLEIDNSKEVIETDIPLIYRYDDHNDVWLSFVRGMNNLRVEGACKIRFKYQFKTLAG